MNIITDLLEVIYKEITLPIINFIAGTPVFLTKLTLYLLIVTLGYIIGRFIDLIARIILSYIKLDNFFKENNLENAFFNINPSIYIRKLIRYYIYLYFIIVGLEKFNIEFKIILNYLNMFYTIIIIISIGLVVSAVLEKYFSKITNKRVILNFIRGLTIYIFSIWALEVVNLPTSIFYTILSILLISIAISLGLFIGVIFALEYKEEIKKILK